MYDPELRNSPIHPDQFRANYIKAIRRTRIAVLSILLTSLLALLGLIALVAFLAHEVTT